MKRGIGILAMSLILGTGSLARANVAVHVFEDDPARTRYVATEIVVACAVWTAVILSGVWFVRSKGLVKLLPVALVIGTVLGCTTYMTAHSNIRYVEGNRPANYVGGFFVSKDQSASELVLKHQLIPPWAYGLALALVFTTAGFVVRRRLVAQSAATPAPPLPMGYNEGSPIPAGPA